MILIMFVLIIASPLHSLDPPQLYMEESDNYYDCLQFPCYTAEWKVEWVSMKYLTRHDRKFIAK